MNIEKSGNIKDMQLQTHNNKVNSTLAFMKYIIFYAERRHFVKPINKRLNG